MDKRGALKILREPLFIVFIVALSSYFIYYNSRQIANLALHQALATIFGTIYFISIFFGALFIYTTKYVQGVSLGKRILASCTIPFLWVTKDVFALMESHPFLECLYWYFNPLTIWMLCLLAIEMGFGTLLGRILLKRRGQQLKIITPIPIAAILIGAATFAGIYAWGQGENLFSLYLHGYRLLFGSGI
jgi:hypothetical protein